jgi:hypothetical protein
MMRWVLRRRTPQRFPLPGDKVEVGGAGARQDRQLTRALQGVFQLVDALAADVGLVEQRGIGGPGDAAAVIGVDGEIQQEGAGTAFALGFFADMVYDRYRHGELTPLAGVLFMSWGAGGLDLLPFFCHGRLSKPWGSFVSVLLLQTLGSPGIPVVDHKVPCSQV